MRLDEAEKLLGVSAQAGREAINRAWRRVARANHPDRFTDERAKQLAHERFVLLSQARDVLFSYATTAQSDASGSGAGQGVWEDLEDFDLDEEMDLKDEAETDEEEEDEDEAEEHVAPGPAGEPGSDRLFPDITEATAEVVSTLLALTERLQKLWETLAPVVTAMQEGETTGWVKALRAVVAIVAAGSDVGTLSEGLMRSLQGMSEAMRPFLLRFERGERLAPLVTAVGGTYYLVPSERLGGVWYHVDLGPMLCDCPDFAHHGTLCKHIMAVLIHEEMPHA